MNAEERAKLLKVLQGRFEKNMQRHKGVTRNAVASRPEGNAGALKSLAAMEATGGEPDVVGHDRKTGRVTFMHCSPQSPGGRRSTCYDRKARVGRRKHPPERSPGEMAAALRRVGAEP